MHDISLQFIVYCKQNYLYVNYIVMFKYIAEILSKLSTGQRLMGLVFLLFTITIISVGPKIVGSFTQDNEELKMKVERQRIEIVSLNERVGELSDQILKDQMSCTDKFISREKEIMDLLSNIESVAKSENGKVLSTQTVYERAERPRYVEEYNPDEPRVARMEMPATPVEKTVVVKADNTKMLKMITKVKKNVADHMGH